MQDAAERWHMLSQRLPAAREAWLEALETLRTAGDHEAVDAGFGVLLARNPTDTKVAIHYAGAATLRGDWAEAARRWQAVLDAEPGHRVAVNNLSEALMRLGAFDLAESLLTAALAPFGGGDLAATDRQIRRMMVNQARLASRQRKWDVARRHWGALKKQLPGDPIIQAGYRQAQGENASEQAAPRAPAIALPEGFWQRFEGLGGNCEFGLVQRHFGAEPLGLFRWVSLGPNKLCRALHHELAGIGADDFTRLDITEGGEFSTSDTRYGLGMHSFIKDTGQDREQLFRQLKRRMVFLRRKLLEDLAAGEKIFVYRAVNPVREETILSIAAALQRYNPNNALLAVLGDELDAPPGELVPLGHRTAYVTVQDGRKMPHGTGWDVQFQSWAEACTKALAAL